MQVGAVIAGAPADAGGIFRPSKIWEWSPLGYLVVGVNETYRFELRPANAPVIRIEHSRPTVSVLPEERAELEARNEWLRTNQGQFLTSEIPPVPATKPPYRSFLIGQDGSVWVRLHVAADKVLVDPPTSKDRPPPASWVEPPVYDVFEPDGTYLGEVRVPNRTRLMVARRGTAWGVREGESGEIYVVRLRIPPASDN